MQPIRRWGAHRHLVASCAFIVAAAACGPASGVVVLTPGTYRLRHLDGGRGVLGGLRPGELFALSRMRDVFAFSFDHPCADVTLDLRQVSSAQFTVRMFGTAWGSYIRRNAYQPAFSAPARFDFTYALTREAESDDVAVMRPSAANGGTIWFNGMPLRFVDFAPRRRFAFRLADEGLDRDAGLTGSALLVQGAGPRGGAQDWRSNSTSDWTFTLHSPPVPGPATLAVLGTALLAGRSRRRRGYSSSASSRESVPRPSVATVSKIGVPPATSRSSRTSFASCG